MRNAVNEFQIKWQKKFLQ